MSSKWSKEKENFYIIGENTGRKYRIDINNLILYGCSGKALKNIPTEIKYLENATSALPYIIEDYLENDSWRRNAHFNIYKKAVILADKIYSLNTEVCCYDIISIAQKILQGEIKEKDFINYVKSQIEKEEYVINKNEYFVYISLNCMNNYIKDFNLTEEEKEDYVSLFREMIENNFSEKRMKRAFYYLHNEVYDYCRPIDHRYFNASCCLSDIREYFNLCDKMEIEPKKGKFFEVYIEAKNNYRVYKADYDKKALIRNQPKELFFENDKYCVVIPVTPEEFKNEAFQQNNCVFRCYLSDVIDGETNIVFIRDKNRINHSLITCEVRNGVIRQYLAKNNEFNISEELLNFKTEYQNYLNSLK